MPHFRTTGLVVAVVALVAALPNGVRADLRLWEEHPENESQHRYVDLTGYIQPGFIWRQEQDANPGVSSDQATTLFYIQRARLGVKVQLFSWLYWRLELEASPTPQLTDAYAELRFHPAFNVRVGQFQLAFLRTYQFDEQNLAFIDRLVYTTQNPERAALRYLQPRDIGVMFTGILGNPDPASNTPVGQYFAGVFLGDGPNVPTNNDGAYLWSLRANLHVFGMPKGVLAESDLANNEHPKLAIGVGGYTNCDNRGNWNRGFTGDVEFRYRGFFAYATFLWFRNGAAGDDGFARFLGYGNRNTPHGQCTDGAAHDPTRSPINDNIAWGTSVQAQYILPQLLFPVPSQAIEVLARFDYVAPNNAYDGSFFGFAGPGAGGVPPGVSYIPPSNYRDSDNPPSRYRITFGLNYFPTRQQNIRLSVNYQLNLEDETVVTPSGPVNAVHNDIFWVQASLGL